NSYDSGGQVRQAVGQKDGNTYHYLDSLQYDKFEQRAYIVASNGVRTLYQYNADNRRLHNLQAGRGQGQGNQIQNLIYSYDNVGNILSLHNDVPVPPPSQYGGPV